MGYHPPGGGVGWNANSSHTKNVLTVTFGRCVFRIENFPRGKFCRDASPRWLWRASLASVRAGWRGGDACGRCARFASAPVPGSGSGLATFAQFLVERCFVAGFRSRSGKPNEYDALCSMSTGKLLPGAAKLITWSGGKNRTQIAALRCKSGR